MNPSAKELVEIFENLPGQDQKTLLDFAEFLKSRAPVSSFKPTVAKVLDIPRPETESVIAAIKRLTEAYPMIERSSMFSETSDLMMQHTMTGLSAADVIDEMEVLFQRKLQAMLEDSE